MNKGTNIGKYVYRTTACPSLINKCPNHNIVLNLINFDLNIFGPLPIIGAGFTPDIIIIIIIIIIISCCCCYYLCQHSKINYILMLYTYIQCMRRINSYGKHACVYTKLF